MLDNAFKIVKAKGDNFGKVVSAAYIANYMSYEHGIYKHKSVIGHGNNRYFPDDNMDLEFGVEPNTYRTRYGELVAGITRFYNESNVDLDKNTSIYASLFLFQNPFINNNRPPIQLLCRIYPEGYLVVAVNPRYDNIGANISVLEHLSHLYVRDLIKGLDIKNIRFMNTIFQYEVSDNDADQNFKIFIDSFESKVIDQVMQDNSIES
jgi:hypothetical protein